MSRDRIRDYVTGWVAYHSGPNADVEALTERVCARLRHNPNRPLTRVNRKELRRALGTKDAEDARTLTEITRSVLADYVEVTCSQETAHAVAETVLAVYETGWDLEATTALPTALASAYEDLLDRDLTTETAVRLVEAHMSSQPGTELSEGL